MFNIVLYAPEIPANTGNIGRTCVVTGARLHLVEPLGFSLDDKTVRRAGLGYWQNLDVTTYAGWEDFLARNDLSPADGRLHLLTKKARRTYAQSTYRDGDYLVFGSESSGIPEPLLAAASERCERIPMLRDCDSLDNAEAWEAHEESLGHTEDSHEAILRQDICGNFVNPDDYRISALNLSNSAASSSTRPCAKQAFRECDKGTVSLSYRTIVTLTPFKRDQRCPLLQRKASR